MGDGWEAKATASGPFQVDSWNRDTGEVSWVQNKNWWGAKPLIKKVTYRYIKDNNTSSIMYDNNEMDVFLPADIISAQLRKGAHASELHLIPYGGEYYYLMRTDTKPFDDPKVRLAFLKATDMATAVQAVFQGGQVPATGLISPNLDCYQNLKSYYDPAGAKMALAESTYKTADALPPITVAVGTNLTEYIQLSEAVQQMWKQNLGVEVTIHKYDKATDPALQTAQIFRRSLGTLIYDTSASISAMAASENTPFKLGTGGGYVNSKVDDFLHKADTLPLNKNADRCSMYDQAETIAMSEAPYIPIIWVNYYYAVMPWVKIYASNIDLSLYSLASNPPLYIAKH
jgi:oligopeptide transport system substrate-binding protein